MRIVLIVLLWLAVGLAFTQWQLPGNSLLMNSLQNAGHGLVFFTGTLLTYFFSGIHATAARYKLALLIILLMMLGIAVEIVQAANGRGASPGDVIMNAAGITAGGCTLLAARLNKATAVLSASAAAIALLAWCLHIPATYFLNSVFAKPLPILQDFESVASIARMRTTNATASKGNFPDHWSTNASQLLRVDFHAGRWPSVRFLEPHPDWSQYSLLNFKVVNAHTSNVQIRVRVDDTSIDYPDHSFMTVRRDLAPGLSSVDISLEELRDDARSRGLASFRQIVSFMIYLPKNPQVTQLLFDDFRLQ